MLREVAAAVAPPAPAEVAGWRLACPACRAALEPAGSDALRCTNDGRVYCCVDGIWRMLSDERAAYYAPFLRDYSAIRAAEGYGYADPACYRRLPAADAADPMAAQWRMRARSFDALRRRVVTPLGAGLRVVDIGAGVSWLSNRLALLGHTVCAIDLNDNPRDGLGAWRFYASDWTRVQAEFDHLPLADAQADLVIYNAALHYSADYRVTLAEGLRVLRPGGQLVVMDSPIYQHDASGQRMIAERQAAFERSYGTRSDALPNVGYLTWEMLRDLGRELGLRWSVVRPWYGWRWAVRPWRARLTGAREPSRFALLVALRVRH